MEKGFLPEDGGWSEQPAKFTQIMDILNGQSAVIVKENRKRQSNDK